MKIWLRLFVLLLRHSLLIGAPWVCAWPGTSSVQAAAPGLVLAWGDNNYGQTTVPVAAQNGVTVFKAM